MSTDSGQPTERVVKPSATHVSRQLRTAGHTLVYPDRRRQGMSVRQLGEEVWVSLSFNQPEPHLAEIIDDVTTTLTAKGYTTRLAWQNEFGASIVVTRSQQQNVSGGSD